MRKVLASLISILLLTGLLTNASYAANLAGQKCSKLLRLGEPLHVVSKRLGHADPMVTATIYAHVSDEQADTASTTFANNANLA